MAVAETELAVLQATPGGVWWFEGWAPAWVAAGIADRRTDVAQLAAQLPPSSHLVQAEQVHGASVTVIECTQPLEAPIAGCDALLTGMRGIALLIRTADCLPLFIVDPVRRVVGLAHAGWRGLAAQLPLRCLATLRHVYRSRAEDLRVAIGPGIRACCYDVGPEFEARFGPFVQRRDGRRACDLVGLAIHQLRQGGIRPGHVMDSQRCTACEAAHWFSTRREGQATGRLISFITIVGER